MAARRGADRGAGHAHAVRETGAGRPPLRHRGCSRRRSGRGPWPAASVRLAARTPSRRAARRVAAPAAGLDLAPDRSSPRRRRQRHQAGAAARLARGIDRARGHTRRRQGRHATPLARHSGRSAASRTRRAPPRAGHLALPVGRLAHVLLGRSPRRAVSRDHDASGMARDRRRRRPARPDRHAPALHGLARTLHAHPHPPAGDCLDRPSRRGRTARTGTSGGVRGPSALGRGDSHREDGLVLALPRRPHRWAGPRLDRPRRRGRAARDGTPSGGRGRSTLGRGDSHREVGLVLALPRRPHPGAGHRLDRPSRRGRAARAGTPGGDRGSGDPRPGTDRCSNRHPRPGRRRSRPRASPPPPALRQLGLSPLALSGSSGG